MGDRETTYCKTCKDFTFTELVGDQVIEEGEYVIEFVRACEQCGEDRINHDTELFEA